MTTRSAVLFNATIGTLAGWVNAAQAPANEVWIVKSAHVLSAPAGPNLFYLRTVRPSNGAVGYLISQDVGSNVVFQWEGWHVMEPGDQLWYYTPVQPVYLWVSGAKLIAP